jgi:hypothetical protein
MPDRGEPKIWSTNLSIEITEGGMLNLNMTSFEFAGLGKLF